MKTLKLKKDDLEAMQGIADEVHGMQIIIRDLCKRRNELTHKVRKIIHAKTKAHVDYEIHFSHDGKIKAIEIKD